MRRFEIRNEYGAGNEELYKSVDKNDPEVLLEGVAMAGLVGVLRQLGDLAEFAAEIFHDLHEDVMTTAARSHIIMARVQQLEADVPFIEKSFVAESYTPFFTNFGSDWHADVHIRQNVVTHGNLPRFVMDSCEECRGPPRLFLLDKFDVAGAGACLKRYSDPALFRVQAEAPQADSHREKKSRKLNRNAPCWKKGDTLQSMLASTLSLHQLFTGHHSRLAKGLRSDSESERSFFEKFRAVVLPDNHSELLTDENKEEDAEKEITHICESKVFFSAENLVVDENSESRSEDASSEVEKYVDAPNSVVSENETDREVTDSNYEQPGAFDSFSESRSVGASSASREDMLQGGAGDDSPEHVAEEFGCCSLTSAASTSEAEANASTKKKMKSDCSGIGEEVGEDAAESQQNLPTAESHHVQGISEESSKICSEKFPITSVESIENPPLPPLPPMQWRLNKPCPPRAPQIPAMNLKIMDAKSAEGNLCNGDQSPQAAPNTMILPAGKLNHLNLPRNPLMDAAAAVDRSKLRKVTERHPKSEERDSLLEQIRTKSFNLRPPSMARNRPSVHAFPATTTNLKVAAILEKANAIRQALAGSDEEEDGDDESEWNDS